MAEKINDKTIIYYSSNKEKPEFEDKIVKLLLKMSKGLPIVSVSQKPMKLGTNICVGDVGTSDHNIFRQIQLGCQKATTKFVCFAESDCLYPPKGYFDFIPEDENKVYLNTNVYILYKDSHNFRKKDYSLCALVCGRKKMLEYCESMLKDYPMWKPNRNRFRPPWHKGDHWTPFQSKIAVVNIKTGDGLRYLTGTRGKPIYELLYWGTGKHIEEFLWKN